MQKQAAANRAESDELTAMIADLEEQVAEATTQLKLETESKVNALHELDRVKEGLEFTMSSFNDLKARYDDKCEECDDKTKQASCSVATAFLWMSVYVHVLARLSM